jgi:hypothetical protein
MLEAAAASLGDARARRDSLDAETEQALRQAARRLLAVLEPPPTAAAQAEGEPPGTP